MLIAHRLGPAWALGHRRAGSCCDPASVIWVTRPWEVGQAAPLLRPLCLAPDHLVALWVPQTTGEQRRLTAWEPYYGSCPRVMLGRQLWRSLWIVWMFSYPVTPSKIHSASGDKVVFYSSCTQHLHGGHFSADYLSLKRCRTRHLPCDNC